MSASVTSDEYPIGGVLLSRFLLRSRSRVVTVLKSGQYAFSEHPVRNLNLSLVPDGDYGDTVESDAIWLKVVGKTTAGDFLLSEIRPDEEPGAQFVIYQDQAVANEKHDAILQEAIEDAVIDLTLECDEEVPDESVLNVIERLVFETDSLHRNLGGHGLTLYALEVLSDKKKTAETP